MARKPDLDLAVGLAHAAGEVHDWYGLGRRDPGAIQLFVVRGEERVSRLLSRHAPAWGAGFAIPSARTIVVRVGAGDPYRILRHELAHFALHDSIRVRVPLWFDEGYAALAAGELDRLVALRLNLSVARGAIPGFFELDRALRSSEATAAAAYALAATAVQHLAQRHPDRSLGPLLARLGAGEDFSAAVLATTGFRLGHFELEWQKVVRRRFGLFGWMMAGGMWVGIALLVVAAVWLRRRRDRPRRQALDQGWVIEPEPEPRLDEAAPGP